MENDAVRFETGEDPTAAVGGLDFILKDLQLNEHLRESARLAELVERELEGVHTGESRGVKQAGFMVLTTARRPAILVEMGYSTNPEDGRFLTTRSSQKAMAASIADAVVEYLLRVRAEDRRHRRRGGRTVTGRPGATCSPSLTGAWLLGGCVYYNGMYNTNRLAKSARKAERDGRAFEAKNLWGQVITRAETLVVRHPRSKYADRGERASRTGAGAARSVSRRGRAAGSGEPRRPSPET